MCGIAGIVGWKNPGPVEHPIRTMTRRLAHRGPDGEGIYTDPGIALGHRRLSIIDLSESAGQPMTDASGRYVMVFNGEIYNYREVRAKLPEYPFRTLSDSEVLLAAYCQWGAACLEHLNGMFAFAVWDKEKRELFVARDRLGVKPLYYFHQGGTFAFCSEMRALLASGLIRSRLNPQAVSNYLMYQSVSAPLTVIQDLNRLMPGEYGFFRDGQFTRGFYWQIERSAGEGLESDPAVVRKTVRRLLTESVERRMVSDVPLGAFLSGGIDSSAVVGLMAECSEQPINTFSIIFEEPEFDESSYAALVARRFNTRHTPLLLRPGDFLEAFPEAMTAMDSPSGDGFNSYLVSKVTKQAGITVALSGIGGDELFAGYASFLRWWRLRQHPWWRVPGVLRHAAGKILGQFTDTRMVRFGDMAAAGTPDIEFIYPSFRQILAPRQASQLLNQAAGFEDPLQQLLFDRREDIHRLPVLSQYTVAELLGYTLNVLLKDSDQMGMAAALEVREPFFDYRLIEYVLRIPDHLKYPRYPKSLLVESLAPLLPDEVVHRPKKGFTLPWKNWLRHELRDWCNIHIQRLAERPEFNGDEVRKTAAHFFNNQRNDYWMPVLLMAILEAWMNENGVAA